MKGIRKMNLTEKLLFLKQKKQKMEIGKSRKEGELHGLEKQLGDLNFKDEKEASTKTKELRAQIKENEKKFENGINHLETTYEWDV